MAEVIPQITLDQSKVKNTWASNEVVTNEVYNAINKAVINLKDNNNLLDSNSMLFREKYNSSSKNLNNAIHQGVYSFTSSALNSPTGANSGNLLVTNTSKTNQGSSIINQIAFCDDNSIYMRVKKNSENFTNWIIVTSSGDGYPVGDVVYRPFLKKGYVKANGATVYRSEYPRLVQYATENNLWTNSPTTEVWKFGNGNGSTTFVLPDYRNVFIEGGDTPSKINAGLPNIKGDLGETLNNAGTGAFYGTTGHNGVKANWYNEYPSNYSVYDMHIDASGSSSIYGKSETVQPPSIMLIPQIKY